MPASISTASEESSQIPVYTGAHLFRGEIGRVRNLIAILRTVRIKKMMTINFLTDGLKFVAEDESKTLQISLSLSKKLFKSYDLVDNRHQIVTIVVDDFIRIVQILFPSEHIDSSRTSTLNTDTFVLIYSPEGKLILEVKNGSHSASASLCVLPPAGQILFILDRVNRVVIDASFLADFWTFCDIESEIVLIEFTEEKFTMGTSSQRGKFSQHVPPASPLIEHFECREEVKATYELRLMRHSAPIIKRASRIAIRTDSIGTLQIQFIIPLMGELTLIGGEANSFLTSQQSQRIDPIEETVFCEMVVRPMTNTAFAL